MESDPKKPLTREGGGGVGATEEAIFLTTHIFDHTTHIFDHTTTRSDNPVSC